MTVSTNYMLSYYVCCFGVETGTILPAAICTDGSIRIFDDGEVYFSGEGSGGDSLFEANEMQGILEFCKDANWGTICADSWVNSDASVACRELGYSPYGKPGQFMLIILTL